MNTNDRHLRAVGSYEAFDDDLSFDPWNPRPQRKQGPADHLLEFVGSADALITLNDDPLPDEPFDWGAVEPGDHEFVSEVVALADRFCDEMLDVEYRTITRRILARAAARDPKVLRRSSNVARFAAGLVWLAGRGSGEFGRRGLRNSEGLWHWFGVSSCADRGHAVRRAAGLEPDDIFEFSRYSEVVTLGDATLLHSSRRAMLIAQRDLVLELERKHRRYSLRPDGRLDASVTPAKVVLAAKGVSDKRTVVLLALGNDLDDAEYFGLTITGARDLVAKVAAALNSPQPNAVES